MRRLNSRCTGQRPESVQTTWPTIVTSAPSTLSTPQSCRSLSIWRGEGGIGAHAGDDLGQHRRPRGRCPRHSRRVTLTEALPSPRLTLVTLVTELNGMMCIEPSPARSRMVRTDSSSTVPVRPDDGDGVADLHGVLQQQEDAGDQVLHQLLRAEADRHADDAGAGQQRRDVDADLAQHHQAGDDQDGDQQRRAQQRQQGAQPSRRARSAGSCCRRARCRWIAALAASHTAKASNEW